MQQVIHSDIHEIVQTARIMLEKIYGSRLIKILLFGSWARGTATADSDIDLAIVLGGTVQQGREIDRINEMVTDINLQYGVLLSIYPVSESDFERVNSPLLLNIRREGIAA